MAALNARLEAERRGRFAESLCVWSLRLRGWRILERRLAGKRGLGVGEIDIVAKRGKVVAFIEVKARTSETAALEAVTVAQRARIARAAEIFIARFPGGDACDVRFDVMTVSGFLPVHLIDAWRP
ncbi:MAG: YraN family protein [Proteobacteria bacterium]|nr:YraN family protein [Pseudomonadota bacterium]